MILRAGKVTATYAVMCGRCKDAHESALTALDRAEAIRDFEEAGWTQTRRYGWVCNLCSCEIARIGNRFSAQDQKGAD